MSPGTMELRHKLSSAWVLTAVACAALATPAAAGEPATGASPPAFVPGQLLVQFEPGTSRADSTRIAHSIGARVSNRLEIVPNLAVIELPAGLGVKRADRSLSSLGQVRRAQPNFVRQTTVTPDDTLFGGLWGLRNIGQPVNGTIGTPDADIDAPEAWEDGRTGDAAVVVGVIDTGLAVSHPDLAANTVSGWDFVEDDATPEDHNTHGTHVAGTIGAVGNNAIGVTGVNWDVSLMPLKAGTAQGGLTVARIIEAIQFADAEGADVVNASFGGPTFTQMERDAIAAASDILFVAAAGNEARNNDSSPVYPCNYDLANLICVAATTQLDGRASFSNFGKSSVDLGAPGTNIRSTEPAFQTLFLDTFESPDDFATTWSTGGTNGAWSRISAPGKAFSGTHAMTDSAPVGTNYLPNADHWAQTITPVSLTGKSDCRVTLGVDHTLAAGADALFVEGSKNGATWTELGTALENSGRLTVIRDIPDDFEGLPNFYLRVRLFSDASSQADGAYVDDVRIQCALASTEAYRFRNGTSMATPHVAGAAALLIAERGYGVPELRTALLHTVDQLGALGCLLATGGRLNLDRAIQPGANAAPAPPDNCQSGNQALAAADEDDEEPPSCAGKRATIVGTDGNDKLKGTKKSDVIVALAGDDTVFGRGGNDRICGGDGRDRLYGGAGKDRLYGGAGKDRLFGGPGKDRLFGGPGKDLETA